MLFDANKLDISDEFRRSIEAIHGYEDKVRIILNKADQVDHQVVLRKKKFRFDVIPLFRLKPILLVGIYHYKYQQGMKQNFFKKKMIFGIVFFFF